MKKYEVWREGWIATGNNERAFFYGIYEADNFREACKKAVKEHDSEEYFDENILSDWGCRMFDNEKDARKFND